MRIADLNSGAARLRDAAEVLAANWDDTRQFWRDANSRSLEETRLRPLADDVNAALAAIAHLSELLMQAQRHCESWEEH